MGVPCPWSSLGSSGNVGRSFGLNPVPAVHWWITSAVTPWVSIHLRQTSSAELEGTCRELPPVFLDRDLSNRRPS